VKKRPFDPSWFCETLPKHPGSAEKERLWDVSFLPKNRLPAGGEK
jgi:hypothetical protein